MKTTVQLINGTAPFTNPLTRSSWRRGFLLLVLGLSFVLLPTTRAVDPPPDGGYPNGNTAEGDNALFSLTSGTFNTAIGLEALFKNTVGVWNTAIGTGALHENTANYNTATGTNALWNNTTGLANTANGVQALYLNGDGSGIQHGHRPYALYSNTTGDTNTAFGIAALFSSQPATTTRPTVLRSNSTLAATTQPRHSAL